MQWALILPGLVWGLVNSFHCIGMCGPIAFSLPVSSFGNSSRTLSLGLYNAGRITTYCILGFFSGLIGRQFFIGKYQQWLSIVLGIILLIYFIARLAGFRKPVSGKILNSSKKFVQNIIIKYLGNPRPYSFFIIGLANGLLPCAMVYIALTGAMATGSITGGMLYMLLFGIGTLPAMAGVSLFGLFAGKNARNVFRKVVPYFVAVMAVLLILRGMNLNIPFVSPKLGTSTSEVIPCH